MGIDLLSWLGIMLVVQEAIQLREQMGITTKQLEKQVKAHKGISIEYVPQSNAWIAGANPYWGEYKLYASAPTLEELLTKIKNGEWK